MSVAHSDEWRSRALGYYPGRIADAYLAALCERAKCGVRVRVVIDAIGGLRTGPSYFEPLIAAGGQVSRYHPLHLHMLQRWNSRTHRNLLVVDGEVGFVGGAGVADHWGRSTTASVRGWCQQTIRLSMLNPRRAHQRGRTRQM